MWRTRVIDSDCCWILISFSSSLTPGHQLVVYLWTAKWDLAFFLFPLICSLYIFLHPIFPNHKLTVRSRWIGWLRWICQWLSTNTAFLLLIVNGCDIVFSAFNIAALTLRDHSHREATALTSSQQQPPRTSAVNLINSDYHHCLV